MHLNELTFAALGNFQVDQLPFTRGLTENNLTLAPWIHYAIIPTKSMYGLKDSSMEKQKALM